MNGVELVEKLGPLAAKPASLKRLVEIYNEDPKIFFELATHGISEPAPQWAKSISELAQVVRTIVREGFDITPSKHGKIKIKSRTYSQTANKQDESAVIEFLHTLNGTAIGDRKGKDYEGRQISEAEIEFKFGELSGDTDEELYQWLNSAPVVLKLDDEDRNAVSNGMPAYVVYGLLYSAPNVVHSPTAVFKGLRHEGKLSNGIAYCGAPEFGYDNNGKKRAMANMCFVVYVDSEGYVFDWDWVKSSTPGYPSDWKERFSQKLDQYPEATLTGLSNIKPSRFSPESAWFSQRGDCVFWYKSDSPAHAVRINDELTVFKDVENSSIVGCKLKNVSLMMRDLANELEESPYDLKVLIAGSLFRQTVRGTASWQTYKSLLGPLFGNGGVSIQNLERTESDLVS